MNPGKLELTYLKAHSPLAAGFLWDCLSQQGLSSGFPFLLLLSSKNAMFETTVQAEMYVRTPEAFKGQVPPKLPQLWHSSK